MNNSYPSKRHSLFCTLQFDFRCAAAASIDGNLSPQWAKIYILDYDESQAWTPIKISLYDCRKGLIPNLKLGADPTMGEANVESGEVLKMAGQEQKVELNQGGW